MKEKIRELRDLMAEEGMNESLNLLEETFKVKDKSLGRSCSESGKNSNSNATVKAKGKFKRLGMKQKIGVERLSPVQLNVAQSEDTIYDSAVKKRISSSSEECPSDGQNTSDETFEIDFDKINVNDGIVGDQVVDHPHRHGGTCAIHFMR